MKILRAGWTGAVWGSIAWLAYGAVEFAFVGVAPARYGMFLADWYWKLSGILLIFYVAAGLATGGILGAVTAGRNPRTAGALSLTLAFLVNLAAVRGGWPSILAASVFAAALLWSLKAPPRGKQPGLLTNPWAAASFLMIAAWTDNGELLRHSFAVRFAGVAIVLAVFALLAWLESRIPRSEKPPSLQRQAIAVLVGILLISGAGLFFERGLNRGAIIASTAPVTPADPSRPNVILLTMDTVRADHLSLYGYVRDTTPNLAVLAQSATVYSHPVAASNQTLISHAAIFTGVYGSWNGARYAESQTPISRRYPTMAELLEAQGYATAAFAANSAYLTPYFGVNRGFEVFEVPDALNALVPQKKYCLRYGVRKVLDLFIDTAEFDLEFVRSEEINRAAFRWLDRTRSASRPFFLFLNYMDAHGPYIPPAPFKSHFAGHDRSLDRAQQLEAMVQNPNIERGRGLAHFLSQYDGGIAYIDSQIGVLIAWLKDRGMYDNTLIVITGDHGEGLGEHDLWGHGTTTFENVVYVPLLVKYPRQTEARRLDESAGHIDILPTVLDVTGVPSPGLLQGRSLRSSEASRLLLSEAFPSFHNVGGRRPDYTERALFEQRFKFVGTSHGARALYDLSADPSETRDICETESARCAAMQLQLDQWVRAIPPSSLPRTKLDSRSLERLRALGYIGN
jgi:arylsulfatase A-like enzyme